MQILRKTVLLTAVLATAFSLTQAVQAINLEGLFKIYIDVDGDSLIDAGESVDLQVYGDYGTKTIPVNTSWSITHGQSLGHLSGCDNAHSCEFQSNRNHGGSVVVTADAGGGFRDQVTITVEPPPAPPPPVPHQFTDEVPDWANNSIVNMQQLGIFRGYDDGRFGAADPVTNGQVATVIYRALNQLGLLQEPSSCSQVYGDVPPDHYAFVPLCALHRRGWVESTSTYRANEPSLRGEIASVLNRVIGPSLMDAQGFVLGAILMQGQVFPDVPVTHMFYADTVVMKELNIMTGNEDGSFGVDEQLNRAATATVLDRVIHQLQVWQVDRI